MRRAKDRARCKGARMPALRPNPARRTAAARPSACACAAPAGHVPPQCCHNFPCLRCGRSAKSGSIVTSSSGAWHLMSSQARSALSLALGDAPWKCTAALTRSARCQQQRHASTWSPKESTQKNTM